VTQRCADRNGHVIVFGRRIVYAPELNPDEWVWSWTKYGRLSNLAAWDADELWDHIVMELIDLKFQPRLLKAFLEEAGLPMAA
jgi:hypothetical protein